MINGYVTFEELKILTGLDRDILNQLVVEGLPYKRILFKDLIKSKKFVTRGSMHKDKLFNFDEACGWIIRRLM
jgi:hypothetical protein